MNRDQIDYYKNTFLRMFGENADIEAAKEALKVQEFVRFDSFNQYSNWLKRASYELSRELHPEIRGEEG